MPPEQWAHAIAASVAPAVIISASALLCLALYNRLATIISRIRAVQRERLALQERIEAPAELAAGASLRLTCILENLAHQSDRIWRRARLVRNSLMCLLATIAALILCSLFNGITTFYPDLAVVAASFFVLGLLTLFSSILFAARELLAALASAEFETSIVSELTGTGSVDTPPA